MIPVKVELLLLANLLMCKTSLSLDSNGEIFGMTGNQTSDKIGSEKDFLNALPTFLFDYITESNVVKILEDYCPHLMICAEDSASIFANVTDQECCLSCECGNDCFAKGNCCIDKEFLRLEQPHAGQYTQDGRTCIETFVLNSERLYMPKDRLYLLHQTCLNRSQIETTGETYSNNSLGNLSDVMDTVRSSFVNIDEALIPLDDLISGCTFPNDANVLDVTPVTSLDSGQSYRNLYCAFCNNDGNNRIAWDISVDCLSDEDLPEILFHEEATEQEVFLAFLSKRLCSIYWNTPKNIYVEKCFPLKYMVSNCPPYVPELISDLCKSESFVVPYLGKASVYRNVFCFICNFYLAEEDSLNPLDCPSTMNMGNDKVSMSFLLDFKTLSTSKSKDLPPETGCDSLFTYNEDLVCTKSTLTLL